VRVIARPALYAGRSNLLAMPEIASAKSASQ
jgi:hypothetical protein